MSKCRLVFLFFVLTYSLTHLLTAAEITPVANISLLGGQYFLEGDKDSFAGNADIFFSPVINFSEDSALLPIYQGIYSNTKDVKELIGGGTLTREVLDNSLTLKFTHKFSDTFKGKVKAGYKLEYLKETEDEDLGDGLFDYNRLIGGIEGEKKYESWNLRAGYDFYIMSYPNYSSLVTTYQTSIDTATYTEISGNAGEDVLDYSTHELFIEGLHSFNDTTVGKISYDISYKDFKDQTIVKIDGSFFSEKRNDLVQLLTLGVAKNLPKITAALYNSVQYYDSSQNSYDAGRTQYNSNYYDFIQNNVTPSLTFNFGDVVRPFKGRLILWWDIAYRKYINRPSQDEEGNYKTSEISQVTNTTGLSLIIPVYKSVSIKTAANYRDATSNNRYEANYRYNYNTSNYFAGMNWEY
ncbi:MAG: hypothetical protein Q7K21_02010 [Elusimicrobiota bacterium]|nr:hypothetical protein [Elusimicrobiota bacterium]